MLSNDDRREIWARFQQDESLLHAEIGIDKSDLRAAVDAIDEWVGANKQSFNQAIPQPARGILSARQKARMFMQIVRRRFERE